MPRKGRGRGQRKGKYEEVRRPGEAPKNEGSSIQPEGAAAHQDVPVQEMEDMKLVDEPDAGGGRGSARLPGQPQQVQMAAYSQHPEAHGGARPKTSHLQQQAGRPPRGVDPSYTQPEAHHLPRPPGEGSDSRENVRQREDREAPRKTEGGEDGGNADRQRRPRYTEIHTRPAHMVSTRAKVPEQQIVNLTTNYFSLRFPENLVLYQYHVDFNPLCESRNLKAALLYIHEELIGGVHAFDGQMLFLPRRLRQQFTEVYSNRQSDNAQIRITIQLTNELTPNDPSLMQVYNIILGRMLKEEMTQIQRHHFDFNAKIEIPQHRLQVIPGVSASILSYEREVLLNVDIAHKLLRMDTVLDVMYEEYRKRENQDDIVRRIVGSIVLTRYNNRTYRVDDIDFDLRCTDAFQLSNGNRISYEDYFKQHYNETVTDPEQPLLVSKPSRREQRLGRTEPYYLVPEFCILTGLSEEMRSDYKVMQDVAVYTRIAPDGRIQRLKDFRNRLQQNERICQEVANWGFDFAKEPLSIKGHMVHHDKETITMAGGAELNYRRDIPDWTNSMKDKKLLVPVPLKNWLVIYPSKLTMLAQDLIQSLKRVGGPMGLPFQNPTVLELPNDRNDSYVRALVDNITPDIQMVLCVVPNVKKDRYDAIKKICCCEKPVPSQVVLQRTLSKRHMLLSVATKIALQINCKLGGEIWALHIPFTQPFMIIGIDTYHDSSSKKKSVAGVVCSLNKTVTRFYSRTSSQETHVELVNGLTRICTGALRKFHEINKVLPAKIIIYRDGVGDGQLDGVFEHEMPQVIQSIQTIGMEGYMPQISFLVVKKRINTRFFLGNENPRPGTVVDSDVTRKEWYDFFLVSQSVRQGTVSPTHYNVLYDMTGLPPIHMQRLAYKMTHLYYNWPGTIRVPAPCQYAHKLAFLVGQSLHREPSYHLCDKLFYL